MNKKILIIIGIFVMVAGAVIAALTDVPIVEYPALAAVFVGAALTCVGVYKKSEKKDWKVVAAITLVALGSFILGFAGVAENTVTQIVTAVTGIVVLIIGVVGSLFLKEKESVQKKE